MRTRTFIKSLTLGAAAATLGLASVAANAKDTITLGYVEWDSCSAATNVARVVLEDAGYNVKTLAVTGALMFEGLANGDLDAIVCAWLPTTHEDYYARVKDRVENLGANMESADLGLAVPDYVEFSSIKDLADKDVAKSLNNRIIGIDPGAGLMRLTAKVIEHYELPETLVEGSDATMTAVLANAIRQEKPVVVTSWKPHWMWAAWDLRYLDDPDNVYGDPDEIDTLVRKGLKEDHPKAYAVLDAIKIDGDARGAIMVADREDDTDPVANARKWVEDHAEITSKWLQAGED